MYETFYEFFIIFFVFPTQLFCNIASNNKSGMLMVFGGTCLHFYCSYRISVHLSRRPLADLFSDIIGRCKQGDRKAQESVYNLLAGKMFAVCMRYCANYEEARDVLHDGFVTVFTKIAQFGNTGSFEGWVRRIFVNQALERYRNNAKLTMVDTFDDSDRYCTAPEEDEWGAYHLTEAELLAMVDELPQQYKIVFNLYVIDGLSHKEIGERLGIAEGTSRSNLLRARGILQRQITDKLNSVNYKKQCK